MNDRTSATAARFGISEQCAALQRDLLTLPGAVKVEFDLDGFYDHMEQVIREMFTALVNTGKIDQGGTKSGTAYRTAPRRRT